MNSLQDSTSRREFIKTSGKSAALSVLANVAIPPVHAAGSDLIQVALDRLWRTRRRRGGERLIRQARPCQAGRYGGRLPGTPCDRPEQVAAAFPEPGRRAARSPVSRLRRLSECDGLFEAGRYRHLRHAAGVSLGALHLRDPEGPERLYGKAAHGRRPNEQAHVRRSPRRPQPRTSRWA